jgi:hypothetical protein
MLIRDLTSVAIGIVILAGLAVALKPGSSTGSVLSSGFTGFGKLITAASAG